MLHPTNLQSNSKELTNPAKPAKRLELAFWPTQHGSATPWVGMRYARQGAGAEVVTAKFADPLDAANELMELAAAEGLPVYVGHLHDELLARWRMEGAILYRRNIGREWCTNRFVRQGWDAAHLDDVQPMLFKAWPAMAGIGAE